MTRLTVRLQGPGAWIALTVLAALLAYVVYDRFSPGRQELLAAMCDGYSGTVISKDSETTLLNRWRNRIHSIVVRDDAGTETRHYVSATEWGRLPVGVRVERKPGCGETPMTPALQYLRDHPEVVERMRRSEGSR